MFLLLLLYLAISLFLAILQAASPTPALQTAPPSDIGSVILAVTGRALQLSPIVKMFVDQIGGGLALAGRTQFLLALVTGIVLDFALGVLGSASGVGYKFTLQAAVMALVAGAMSGWVSKAMTDNHTATKSATIGG